VIPKEVQNSKCKYQNLAHPSFAKATEGVPRSFNEVGQSSKPTTAFSFALGFAL